MPRMPKRKKCTACDDDNCKPINCNECKFCLDMPRNGGPGKKKKACKFKRCLNQNIQPLLVNVEVPLAVSDGDVQDPFAVNVHDSEDEAADTNVVLPLAVPLAVSDGNARVPEDQVSVPEDQVSPIAVQDPYAVNDDNQDMILDEDTEQNDEEMYKEDFIPNAEPVV